jgi:hypothetical protein
MLTQSDLKARRDLVDRVIASSGICRSTRLRDLFLYLCTRVLDEGSQDIHELEVGHKVFGRPEQYDTTADNIVRVHASMLRKRLNEFFDNEGLNENYIIEIPRGNYAPVFIERAAASTQHDQAETTGHEPLPLPPAPGLEPGNLTSVARSPEPWRSSAWALRVVSILAILFCGLSIFLFFRGNGPRGISNHKEVTGQPTVRQFWAGLFPESAPAEVVLDDASLDFYVEATGRPVALAEYFDRSYLASLDKGAAPSKLDPELVHSIMLRRQSAFANSATTWKMAQIADELHSTATIQFARDLTFRQIKAGNVILLGNQLSNPWIQSFEPHLSLVWVLDPESHSYYPQDKTLPEPERKQFRSPAVEGNAHAGYATISYLSNPSGNGNVLILSATGGSAMAVAMDFLSDETSMIQVRSRLPKSPNSAFPYFDALLIAEKGSKGLNSAKLAICRPPATTATHNL